MLQPYCKVIGSFFRRVDDSTEVAPIVGMVVTLTPANHPAKFYDTSMEPAAVLETEVIQGVTNGFGTLIGRGGQPWLSIFATHAAQFRPLGQGYYATLSGGGNTSRPLRFDAFPGGTIDLSATFAL